MKGKNLESLEDDERARHKDQRSGAVRDIGVARLVADQV